MVSQPAMAEPFVHDTDQMQQWSGVTQRGTLSNNTAAWPWTLRKRRSPSPDPDTKVSAMCSSCAYALHYLLDASPRLISGVVVQGEKVHPCFGLAWAWSCLLTNINMLVVRGETSFHLTSPEVGAA
eukprot:scaffold228522_cov21-Tisochrysis_lutea.AAC.1